MNGVQNYFLDKRLCILLCIAFLATLLVDQLIKYIVLQGFLWDSDVISIVLVFNKGVAFSMFEFLGDNLKYIQILLLVGMLGFLIYEKQMLISHTLAFGIILGAGSSNLLDRFLHDGVVDYIYWHYKFDFAIFNFADIMINISIGIILLQTFLAKKQTI